MKQLNPQLSKSSQGGSNLGKDIGVAPSHDLGTAEQVAHVSPQKLTVPKTQSAEMLMGPWENAVDKTHRFLWILVHSELETV